MTLYRLIPFVLVALSVRAAADLLPVDLRCDGQTDLAVVRATPELSWRVESASRGQVQSAWQILVAGSPRTLAEDKGDLWDSGKVAASRSPFVRYAGKPLAAGQRCHWKVRCLDADGKPSGWSAPALWEAAPQSPADWQGARWIDDGRALSAEDKLRVAYHEVGHALVARHTDHGPLLLADPIPTAEGTIVHPEYVDLLSAPVSTPLVVVRVVDQGAEFLRFIEERHLKPGSAVTIEARDDMADAVLIRTEAGGVSTIGTKSASKVLVQAAR